MQYADDTQVIVSGKKSELPVLISRMENSLASLEIWFRANALKVNASKSELITFGNRQNLRTLQNLEVAFRDTNLVPCNEVKNLGVIFDKPLSWDSHVGVVSGRCTGMLLGLSHVRHQLPQGVIAALVTALVLSQVRYCISVYGNGTKKNAAGVQKVLNFAAKVIFGRKKKLITLRTCDRGWDGWGPNSWPTIPHCVWHTRCSRAESPSRWRLSSVRTRTCMNATPGRTACSTYRGLEPRPGDGAFTHEHRRSTTNFQLIWLTLTDDAFSVSWSDWCWRQLPIESGVDASNHERQCCVCVGMYVWLCECASHFLFSNFVCIWLGAVKATVAVECSLNAPQAWGGAFECPPPQVFSRLAKIRRRAATPGFHPPYPPSFPQLLWKFRPNVMWGQVTRSGQVTQLQNKFPIAPRLQCVRESYETFGIWLGHQCLQNVYLGFSISVTSGQVIFATSPL